MAKQCPTCYKRILSHSRILKCTVCTHEYHISCCNVNADDLPGISYWFCTFCIKDCLPFLSIVEDEEYKSVIYSLHSDKPIDMNNLDQLVFNPFEWNQGNNTPLSEVDPDLQYFSNPCFSSIQICDYHTEESFNKYIAKKKITASHGISIFAHNVRSLPKHDSEMRQLFSNLEFQFDVIGLCESWLTDDNKDLYGYEGYHTPIQSVRHNKRGGEELLCM